MQRHASVTLGSSLLFAPVNEIKAGSPHLSAGFRALVHAGFIQQSGAGLYSYLPMGHTVMNKLSQIIDREMQRLNASRVTLPTLISRSLMEKTSRWDRVGTELMKLRVSNRDYCLAPTHEEVATVVAADALVSPRSFPIRMYQIEKKFRDEARPRDGLMRSREFVMKDLYTFDATAAESLATYQDVCGAYERIFEAIKLPWRKCLADTGVMGGVQSHEYHAELAHGNAKSVTCSHCRASVAAELAKVHIAPADPLVVVPNMAANTETIEFEHAHVSVEVPKGRTASMEKVAAVLAQPTANMSREQLVDQALTSGKVCAGRPLDLVVAEGGDVCGYCQEGSYTATMGVEVAHAFQLGTKYSVPLDCHPLHQKQNPAEMGCFGIGVSRLMQTLAETSLDKFGLVWRARELAPFDVVVEAGAHASEGAELAHMLSQQLPADMRVLLEDRTYIKTRLLIGHAAQCGIPFLVRPKKDGQVAVRTRQSGDLGPYGDSVVGSLAAAVELLVEASKT